MSRAVGRALLALIIGASGWVTPTAPVAAAEPQLVLVADSSAAMDGSDGRGDSKIAALQGAVGDEAKMRVYGGSCDAGEPGRIEDNAAGPAAIAETLAATVDDFSGTGGRSILLISGGKDTCSGDPCVTAKNLWRQGIQVNVVAFEVDDAARNQLLCTAKQGHGTFLDVQDGLSLRHVVPRLMTTSARPGGTPVTGTVDDTIAAPLVRPGEYADTIAANRRSDESYHSTWYTYDRKADETLHVTATATTPMSVRSEPEISDELSLVIVPEDEAEGSCADAYGTSSRPGPVSASIMLGFENVTEACNEPGRFRIGISLATSATLTTMPLQIAIGSEPKVQNAGALPDWTSGGEGGGPPEISDAGTSIVGGPSYTAAPTIESGQTYNDTIRPAETLLYRVKLDWGQRVAARAVFAPKTGQAAHAPGTDQTAVAIATVSAQHGVATYDLASDLESEAYYSGVTATVGATSTPPTYNNRFSYDDAQLASYLPGYYYVRVTMVTTRKDPDFAVDFHLRAAVIGSPHGEPQYIGEAELPADPPSTDSTPTTGAAEPPASHQAKPAGNDDGLLDTPAAWVALILGVVLTGAGATGLARTLASRRPKIR